MTASPESKLTIPAFILSVVSVLITGAISVVSIYNANAQKQKEFEIQSGKNESDKQTSHGELVFKYISLLNSQNENEQKLAIATLVWTLGKKDADELMASVQSFSPDVAKKVVGDARNEISNLERQRSKNLNLWQGNWSFSFAGSESTTRTGDLRFEIDRDGALRGEVSSDSGPSLQGKITAAELSDDGTTLKGFLVE